MSLEENKASLRKMVEAINQHDIPLAKSFIAAGCVDHTFQIKGPEGYEKFLSLVFPGFPDFHVKVGDMIAEKDKVCVLGRFVGTHTGAYYDPSIDRELAPTGRTISFPFCIVYRLLNGKVYTGHLRLQKIGTSSNTRNGPLQMLLYKFWRRQQHLSTPNRLPRIPEVVVPTALTTTTSKPDGKPQRSVKCRRPKKNARRRHLNGCSAQDISLLSALMQAAKQMFATSTEAFHEIRPKSKGLLSLAS